MTQSRRQARRAWAAAQRKHIKRGNLYHVEFQHDPGCAIYTAARLCNCDPHRVLRDDRGRVLARIEGAGEFDPLELVGGELMQGNNRLPALANEASQAHSDSLKHGEKAAGLALAAGAVLIEAKSLCKHGDWSAWLTQTGIPERTAQRYMKMSRAGCKSAMVADMGVSRAERVASLGLKLWPQDGKGVEAVGGDRDGAAMYAVIWPEGEKMARYWACYLFPDSAMNFFVTRVCSLPFTIGILHEGAAEGFDLHGIYPMDAGETARARAEVEGAV